jgi:hypothetical protein
MAQAIDAGRGVLLRSASVESINVFLVAGGCLPPCLG